MHLLAIDTSCDDSSVAVFDTKRFRVLADVVHSHSAPMKEYGGIVPEIASREHLKALPIALDEALSSADLPLTDIDWIAVTHRPGLIGALIVGVSFAKALAYTLEKPLSAIDHTEGHLFSPFLGENPPPLPWIGLIASGGHTQLMKVESDYSYQMLGQTLDDAAGEAFDKIGKLLGLAYPAGQKIDEWVRNSANPCDRTHYALKPAHTADFDFSFSGLKTAAVLIRQREGFNESDRLRLAASAQEAILESLTRKLEKARHLYPDHNVVVTGGVACNSRLRELLPNAYFPLSKHCTDNAAMIAVAAALRLRMNRLEIAPWSLGALSR